MIVNKCHTDEIENALMEFYKHAKAQGPTYDTAAKPEEGDDTHYYELDARSVEPLLQLIADKLLLKHAIDESEEPI